jgi:superfamily II helicase
LRQRLTGHKAPAYTRPNTPITCPEFAPSVEQLDNMEKLCELISKEGNIERVIDMLEVAELHRELGRFDEAAHALSKVPDECNAVKRKLIEDLVANREGNPVRFRY